MEFKYLEEIEAYLDKELSLEEAAAFEEQLKNDPELAKEFTLYQDVQKGVALHFDQKLKERLKEEDKKLDQQKRFLSWKDKRLYYAAAAIILLLLVPYFFFTTQPDYSQLYADNFDPFPDRLSKIERSIDYKLTPLDSVMLAYREGNYSVANVLMDKYLEEHPNKYELKLYRGISNLELNNVDAAIADFEEVIEHNEEFREQAEWYMVLALLKKKDTERLNQLLDKILQQNTFNRKKAEDIQEAL